MGNCKPQLQKPCPHSPRINSWAKNAASPQPSPKGEGVRLPSFRAQARNLIANYIREKLRLTCILRYLSEKYSLSVTLSLNTDNGDEKPRRSGVSAQSCVVHAFQQPHPNPLQRRGSKVAVIPAQAEIPKGVPPLHFQRKIFFVGVAALKHQQRRWKNPSFGGWGG